MTMTLPEYLQSRQGRVWMHSDTLWVVQHVAEIEATYQRIQRRTEMRNADVRVELEATQDTLLTVQRAYQALKTERDKPLSPDMLRRGYR